MINIAIIGCGNHAEMSHVKHLVANPDVNIVAFCDLDENKASYFNEKYGQYSGIATQKEILKSENVDAVMIFTPDRFHAMTTLEMVDSGKHVFVEKPMADSEEGIHLIKRSLDIANEKDLVITTCFPRRFDTPFIFIKNRLPSLINTLGNIISFNFDFSYHKPSKEGIHVGLLSDHIGHEIDLMNFLFGFRNFKAYRLYDDQVRYQCAGIRNDDISFHFSGTRMLESRKYSEFVTIRFQKGEVMLDISTGIMTIYNHDSSYKEFEICGITDYEERFKAVNDNFIATVQGKEDNYLSHIDMLYNTTASVRLCQGGQYG